MVIISMSREDFITDAFEELKEIIKSQEDGTVEITPGEDRLGEILVTGTENYPVLVGAIAANYIDTGDQPEHLDLAATVEGYSADRWERLVHRALMDVVQRYQRQRPQEGGQESAGNTSSEQSDLDSKLMDIAGMAGSDDRKSNNEEDSPFVNPSDQDVVERFESSLEDLVESLDEREFEFYFPLNIGQTVRDQFLVDGVEIERVENSEVASLFDSVDIDDILSGTESFEDLLESLDLHPTPYNSNWYWRCNITAPSSEEGVTSAQDIINILLGKINYSIFYNSDLLREETLNELLGSNLPDETVIVERPAFILVCDDGDLLDAKIMSAEFGNPVELDHQFQSTYKELGLRKFPPSYGRPTEHTLASALQGFISAAVANYPRDSFFAYWRALEDLSFTDPEDSSSVDVLKRTGRLCSLDNITPLYKRLLETRNALVHSGGSPTITARDTIVLREIFLDAFPEVRDLERHTLSKNKNTNMNYVLKYLENSNDMGRTKDNIKGNIEDLNNRIEENERRIEAIDALESWKDPQ